MTYHQITYEERYNRGAAPTEWPGSRGHRSRARAPPQHDRARGAAQRHAPRRLLPAPARRVVCLRPTLALPAESAVLNAARLSILGPGLGLKLLAQRA
jgi:hypothetical protein